MNDIEPLELTVWFVAVRKLARRSKRPCGNELESLLRHSYHLLQLAPRQFRNMIRSELPEAAFEKLLEEAEFETAARALVGPPAILSLSRLNADLFEARVCLAAELESPVTHAAEPVAALLRAWTQCLVALEGRTIRPQTENLHPAPRRARSGQHLRQTEH